MNALATRRRAFWFGQRGEMIAAWALRLKGYRIVASRFKTPVGEIDLVARRHNLLVFVEVKSRRGRGGMDRPISHRQQQRIIRAASAFVQQNPAFAKHDMRFDLMIIRPWRFPRHIRGAWRQGS